MSELIHTSLLTCVGISLLTPMSMIWGVTERKLEIENYIYLLEAHF